MIAMEMRTFDHDSKRWWVVADERGAVSIHAVIVTGDFHRPTMVTDLRDGARLYPDCITYHRPVPDGTDDAVSDCPALDGRTCDPDAGSTAVYILMQWELLGCADQYLQSTLVELHGQEWPAVEQVPASQVDCPDAWHTQRDEPTEPCPACSEPHPGVSVEQAGR